MAEKKATKEQSDSEITFVCKFCGKSKPLSEMTLQTRFFPVLTACRECEKALQSLKVGDLPERAEDAETEETEETEEDT